MIRINLLPPEVSTPSQKQINPAWVIGTAQTLLLLVLCVHYFPKVKKKNDLHTDKVALENELDRLKPIIAQVEQLEQTKAQLQQQKSLIDQLQNDRLFYPQFMDDFLKLLPGNIWLTTLNTSSAGGDTSLTVAMDVTALDNYAIADLISNLETSQLFVDVDLGAIASTTLTTGGQSLSFHINTIYKKSGAISNVVKKP